MKSWLGFYFSLFYSNIGVFVLLFYPVSKRIFKFSKKESKESNKLLKDLEETFEVVEEASDVLNSALMNLCIIYRCFITKFFVTVQCMNEMSKGTEEEARAISSTSVMMKEAL